MGVSVLSEVSHVAPVSVHPTAHKRAGALEEDGEKVAAEVEHPRPWNMADDVRPQNVDARVDRIPEHLIRSRLLHKPVHPAVSVHLDQPELRRVVHFVHQQRRSGASAMVEANGACQVEICHGIAGQHNECVVEERSEIRQASGSPSGLALNIVCDVDALPGPVPQPLHDLGGFVGNRDDNITDAVSRKQPDGVLQYGLIEHRDQRFRGIGCQGMQTGSTPSGEYDSSHAIWLLSR